MTATAVITSPFIAFYKDDNFGGYIHLAGTQVVYILEFTNGIVKVGQTENFDERFDGNTRNKRVRKVDLVRWWAVKTVTALESERALIRLAKELGGTHHEGGREWFVNVNGLDLIKAASLEFGLGEFDPANPMPHKTPMNQEESFTGDPSHIESWTVEDMLAGMRDMAAAFERAHSGDRA